MTTRDKVPGTKKLSTDASILFMWNPYNFRKITDYSEIKKSCYKTLESCLKPDNVTVIL